MSTGKTNWTICQADSEGGGDSRRLDFLLVLWAWFGDRGAGGEMRHRSLGSGGWRGGG